MPSYLIALVVGALESRYDVALGARPRRGLLTCASSRQIGPRSRVWSEAEYVERAAFEFSEVRCPHAAHAQLCGSRGAVPLVRRRPC